MTTPRMEDLMQRLETLEERVNIRNQPPFDRPGQMNRQTDILLNLHEINSLSLGQILLTEARTEERLLRVERTVTEIQTDVKFMKQELTKSR